MVTKLPKPLVPPGTDLRNYRFMPLDVARLRDSNLLRVVTAEEFRAAVLLWCAAWHQVPAGSLLNDDRSLAYFAGFGRDLDGWTACRAAALHGFIECSDDRLYHSVICEKVLGAIGSKGRAGGASKWQSDRMSRTAGQTRSDRLAQARTKGSHTDKEWRALLVVLYSRCVVCGTPDNLVKDHVIPIYQGGSDGCENLQPMCQTCNHKKGPDNTDYRASVCEDWRKRLQLELEGLQECLPTSANVCHIEEDGEGEKEGQSKEVSEPIGSLSSGDDTPQNSTRENAEQMMAMWNELASRFPTLPAVKRLTNRRIKQAALRLGEIGGIEGWQEALDKIEISGHCLGNNDRGWTASFDFLLQPSSLAKLLEGNYDDRTVVEKPKNPFALAILENRARREN